MTPSLVASLAYNLSHGVDSAALFETGRVFSTKPSVIDPRLPLEEDRLCVAMTGEFGISGVGHSSLVADAPLVFGLVRHVADSMGIEGLNLTPSERPGFHPGRTADVLIDGEVVGLAGELLPSVAASYDITKRVAVIEIALAPLLAVPDPELARAPSTFPHADFDLSFVVPIAMAAARLVEATRLAGGELVEDARVFDEFSGLEEDKKALAIRYRLRSREATLSGEEVAAVRADMIAAGHAIGAVLRGAE
jgi:phenylalanyl-tRNA synthetase beta chain